MAIWKYDFLGVDLVTHHGTCLTDPTFLSAMLAQASLSSSLVSQPPVSSLSPSHSCLKQSQFHSSFWSLAFGTLGSLPPLPGPQDKVWAYRHLHPRVLHLFVLMLMGSWAPSQESHGPEPSGGCAGWAVCVFSAQTLAPCVEWPGSRKNGVRTAFVAKG